MTRRSSVRDAPAALIDHIYAAAAEPGEWLGAVRHVCDALGGGQAALHSQDIAADSGSVTIATHIDPVYQRSYEEHYSRLNVWMTSRKELMQPGRVLTGDMVCSESEFLRSEYYNDWAAPQDMFHLIGAIVLREGSWTYALSIVRGRRNRPWDDRERAAFEILVPHVQRAIQIERRLGSAMGLRRATQDALDQLPVGVILIGENGRPLLLNRVAQEIADSRDGLTVGREGLEGPTPAVTARVRAMVGESVLTGSQKGVCAGGAISVPRPPPRQPLALLIAPLPLHDRFFEVRAAAVVFVSDPERDSPAPVDVLRTLYGLTRAEARLAVVLAAGQTPQAAAEELGLSPHTVRSQLNSVLQKTDTRRQSDLMRLLMAHVVCV